MGTTVNYTKISQKSQQITTQLNIPNKTPLQANFAQNPKKPFFILGTKLVLILGPKHR